MNGCIYTMNTMYNEKGNKILTIGLKHYQDLSNSSKAKYFLNKRETSEVGNGWGSGSGILRWRN